MGLRLRLHAERQPRILLLEGDEPPPPPLDDIEDWVRLPADDDDLQARSDWLLRRLDPGPRPALATGGITAESTADLRLSRTEARLLGALLDRYGTVTTREVLTRVAWTGQPPGRNALDVHILRLRRRLEPVGLVVHTVRNRGYLIAAADDPDRSPDAGRRP